MLGFENPAAFLFIIPLILLVILRKLKIFRKISFPLTLSDWGGQHFKWTGGFRSFSSILSIAVSYIAFFLVIIAFAEPVVHHQEKIYTSKGSDILFVLDTSPSMAAKDIAGGTRLDAARIGIHTLVKDNPGASFALVAMGSEAAVVVPPTMDHDLFLRRLDSLVIGAMGEGSAIGIGLSSAVYHLISSSAPKKCIVLITDGENNAGSVHPETAALLASENNITLYTFGVGTQGAVPIEYVDPTTGQLHSGYYDSEFDSQSLEEIARLAGGKYFGIESTAALSAALQSIARRESVVQTFHLRTVDTRYYHKLLFLAGLLFLTAWIIRRLFLAEIL